MAKTNYTYLNNYHMTTIFMECDERTYCRAHGTQREQIVAFNMAKPFKKRAVPTNRKSLRLMCRHQGLYTGTDWG